MSENRVKCHISYLKDCKQSMKFNTEIPVIFGLFYLIAVAVLLSMLFLETLFLQSGNQEQLTVLLMNLL